MKNIEKDAALYTEMLHQYLETNDEEYLLKAKDMSSSFVSRNIYPEEIVRIHQNSLEALYGNEATTYKKSLQFLLESLIAYRLAYEEFERMNRERLELKSEIQVAANMQKTLLKTNKPTCKDLDVGVISVPYLQLNGDYYYFSESDDGVFSVAIADIIGKGVPAALSMSMIKYAMDSFYDETMSPNIALRNLNNIVERNVTADIFITMLLGQYTKKSNTFTFSSAGHEPGFVYRAKSGTYEEIDAKGIVLGVVKQTTYEEYELELDIGDRIILLTDGVTECKRGERFVTKTEVLEVIDQFAHLSAQEQVERVYAYFDEIDDFELKDDFTLLIITRVV